MKKVSLLLFFIVSVVIGAYAQTSENGFSFQGYAIDPDGKALSSQNITVRFTVYNTGGSGSYDEEQELTSDNYGVFMAIVGAKNLSAFKQLNFGAKDATYNLKVEVKKTSGGSYTTISDAPMQAVPYARFAYNGVPVGTVIPFAGPSTKIPDGWLICDGSSYDGSNAEYSQLYNIIGLTWGGSGSSFRVPDLRGQFLRGVDGGQGIDNDASSRTSKYAGGNSGDNVGSYEAENFKSHNHATTENNHTHGYNDIYYSESGGTVDVNGHGSGDTDGDNGGYQIARTTDGAKTNLSINNSGGNETRPDNAAVYYIIKY